MQSNDTTIPKLPYNELTGVKEDVKYDGYERFREKDELTI